MISIAENGIISIFDLENNTTLKIIKLQKSPDFTFIKDNFILSYVKDTILEINDIISYDI